MKTITFWLDFVSPYAWLAFQRLPQTLQGLSYTVEYRPILLGAVFKQLGHLGPAEIEPKRVWTYRHVLWLGRELGVPLKMPVQHPFNPLPLLRLAWACGTPALDGLPSRWVCETLFRHVWTDGADAADPARLAALQAQLQPALDPASDTVKTRLRQETDAALAAGLFGVPTFGVDGRLFWGLDALPMLRRCLDGDPWFDSDEWQRAADRPALVRPG